jgi:hypothetical protein
MASTFHSSGVARRRCLRRALAVALCLLAAGAARLEAQRPDSTRTDTLRVDSTRARGDSVISFQRLGTPDAGAKPPITARRAFLYSFLVPGLGQARLDRPNGGALFAAVEMGAWLMAFKSRADLEYAKRASRGTQAVAFVLDTIVQDSDTTIRFVPTDTLLNRYTTRLRARRVHYEDWVAVIIFNHLFAGADAFVAAQLWDMPVRGSVRAAGPRALALSAAMEFGGRRPR